MNRIVCLLVVPWWVSIPTSNGGDAHRHGAGGFSSRGDDGLAGGFPAAGGGNHPRVTAVEGLTQVDDFVTAEEEADILAFLDTVDWRPVVMRGQAAKRVVRHYGLDYDYSQGGLAPTDPLPEPLEPLRVRAAALIDRAPEDLVQVLVSRYPEGAGIGWHRDAPMFGSRIVGVSLGGACRMRFRRTLRTGRETAAVELAPRSAYVLAGPARWSWQHSIPATPALRHSITFRTLKRG
jgi:DNA oxidative demethylase